MPGLLLLPSFQSAQTPNTGRTARPCFSAASRTVSQLFNMPASIWPAFSPGGLKVKWMRMNRSPAAAALTKMLFVGFRAHAHRVASQHERRPVVHPEVFFAAAVAPVEGRRRSRRGRKPSDVRHKQPDGWQKKNKSNCHHDSLDGCDSQFPRADCRPGKQHPGRPFSRTVLEIAIVAYTLAKTHCPRLILRSFSLTAVIYRLHKELHAERDISKRVNDCTLLHFQHPHLTASICPRIHIGMRRISLFRARPGLAKVIQSTLCLFWGEFVHKVS